MVVEFWQEKGKKGIKLEMNIYGRRVKGGLCVEHIGGDWIINTSTIYASHFDHLLDYNVL